MLKLLLDEHISPAVAAGLRRRAPGIEVHAILEWEGGRLLGQPDSACLEVAAEHGLTLVTFDLRTIPSLLRLWHEQERTHGGVILCDERTIPPGEIGQLVRALASVWTEGAEIDWRNRVEFLRSGGGMKRDMKH